MVVGRRAALQCNLLVMLLPGSLHIGSRLHCCWPCSCNYNSQDNVMIINVNSMITPISIVVWSPFKFNAMALVCSCLHVHTIQIVPRCGRCGRRQRAAAIATFQGQGMCSVDSSAYFCSNVDWSIYLFTK